MIFVSTSTGDEQVRTHSTKKFDRSNLVAWCIVPFDSHYRSSEDRAAMLKELGIHRLAYDYRAEHIQDFDREIIAMKNAGIEIYAWWFPTTLNDEAKLILAKFKKHAIHPQLWVMGGGDANMSEADAEAFIQAEKKRLLPIVEAAADVGCQVALYNHGGWFGKPENQVRLIKALGRTDVGCVFNLHHAHDDLDRLREVLAILQPHLMAINLNGSRSHGDQIGQKILPIGEGDRDREVIRCLEEADYKGPFGILNHTGNDAKLRLEDNLNGLQWLVQTTFDSTASKPKPTWQTYNGEPEYSDQLTQSLTRQAKTEGDWLRGAKVFASHGSGCLSCHQIQSSEEVVRGGIIGPPLTTIGRNRTAEQLVTSLLWPNRDIDPNYQSTQVLTDDGQVIRGYLRSTTDSALNLFDPATQTSHEIPRASIEDQRQIGSSMPSALVSSLPMQQQLDLIKFVSSLGTTDGNSSEEVLAVLGELLDLSPLPMEYEKAPLEPARKSTHDAFVNRDHCYDFYTKEARYFRNRPSNSTLLPEFPGLDGKEFGHWGNQNEAAWVGNEWNDVKLGNVHAAVIHLDSYSIPKGVAFKIEDTEDWFAVFNPVSLQFECAWQGHFLQFSSVRHGFMDGARPITSTGLLDLRDKLSPAVNDSTKRYLGYQIVDDKLAFLFEHGDGIDEITLLVDSTKVNVGNASERFRIATRAMDNDELKRFRESTSGSKKVKTKTSPKDVIETTVTLGSDSPYCVDTIALPKENPWKIPIYCTGHDFDSSGNAYVSTMHGDVWYVSDFVAKGDQSIASLPTKARWKRFASGLNQSLGLVVRNDVCFVLGRDQITRLHDLDRDGTADVYECFSNVMETSPAGHDYICGLEMDATGNFYTASGNQGLLKLSSDGRKSETLATGFRNPDGLAVFSSSKFTVPCSEGEWTPTSMICSIDLNRKSGGSFYGYRGPKIGGRPELPLVYLPRGVDNSSGGQVAPNADQTNADQTNADRPNAKLSWGPWSKNAIHLSFGSGNAMILLNDVIDSPQFGEKQTATEQGAVIPLPYAFRSGIHRGRYSPIDGQLYVSGMNGWGSYTPDDGCFERLRYSPSSKSEKLIVPVGFHVHANGVAIQLSESATDDLKTRIASKSVDELLFAQCWNYRYSASYGSAEYSPSHTGVRGHDRLEINSIQLIDDAKTLFVEMRDLPLCNQLHLNLDLGWDAFPFGLDLYATVHAMDHSRKDIKYFHERSQAPLRHPIEIDLERLEQTLPNPYRTKIPNSRTVSIKAGTNLSFNSKEFRVQAGEKICLHFENPDVVPHNWVLMRPGSLQIIGDKSNRMIGSPDADKRHYIPLSDDILCFTDIIERESDFKVYFVAPDQPGKYPYACTFPGHWMVMNGTMIVE